MANADSSARRPGKQPLLLKPMKERIVYFLGAGFSAPLGLPVMSDFLLRSKDLYFGDRERFDHFGSVFSTIARMGNAKNYYHIDLFNIEEILSLLEMENYVGSSQSRDMYVRFLADVITALTPPFNPVPFPMGWDGFRVSDDPLVCAYAAFVATLFGIDWTQTDDNGVRHYPTDSPADRPQYSVITLNYDLVLEQALDLVNAAVAIRPPLCFGTTLEQHDAGARVSIAKLHGSVAPPCIVPPTWNKVANRDVEPAWRLAYRLLAEANQIRFLGYSLPQSDTYVRYLLASAALESPHLKKIDVICLDDPENSVRRRFQSLISYYRLRFHSGDIREYLNSNLQAAAHNPRNDQGRLIMHFDWLENIHDNRIRRG